MNHQQGAKQLKNIFLSSGFFAIILLTTVTSHAGDWQPGSEDHLAVSKIAQLIEKSRSKTSSPLSDSFALVYFRGSPTDAVNIPEAGDRVIWMAQQLFNQSGVALQSSAIHHTSWSEACDSLKRTVGAKFVLIGHSYGVAGATKTAHCLAQAGITVDLFISYSSYDFLSGVDVTRVPSNVVHHFNFSTNSPMIPGYDNHQAIDPARTQVVNALATVQNGNAHLQVAYNLAPLSALIMMAESQKMMNHLQIPSEFASDPLTQTIQDFWR